MQDRRSSPFPGGRPHFHSLELKYPWCKGLLLAMGRSLKNDKAKRRTKRRTRRTRIRTRINNRSMFNRTTCCQLLSIDIPLFMTIAQWTSEAKDECRCLPRLRLAPNVTAAAFITGCRTLRLRLLREPRLSRCLSLLRLPRSKRHGEGKESRVKSN